MLLSDNKNFWKVVKPLFTEKGYVGENNVVFSEREKYINDDKKVSDMLNSDFHNIVTTLDIWENTYIREKVPADMEPINKAIIRFQNYLSALLIKEKVNNLDNTFSFEEIEINEVIKEISPSNPKKAGTDNISAKILRNCKDLCASFDKIFSIIL